MGNRIPKQGECYRHFKGERYQVIAIAKHSETMEEMVVYQGLYGEHPTYVRPIDLFTGKIDKMKFPDVKQEYRFELEDETAVPDVKEHTLIVSFLELKTNEEKIEFLQQMKDEITEEFMEFAAHSLEFTEKEELMELRLHDMIQFLKTRIRYESGRIR